MKVLGSLLLLAAAVCADTIAVYENDATGWAAAAGSSILIDFETPVVADATFIVPTGSEYLALPGGPTFYPTVSSERTINSTLAIINPGVGLYDPNFFAISGENVFAPDADVRQIRPEGIVRLTFASPVTAISAIFIDVEEDHFSTGFDLDFSDSVIDVVFSSGQGDESSAFLGITRDTPFSMLDIHFSTSDGDVDGVAIDDLRYVLAPTPIPEPSTLALFGAALVGFGIYRRRRKAS